MYKYIHLMKVGLCELSNHELKCVESWKKIYPDFEIKVWTNEQIYELAQDCEYARDNLQKGRLAYVIDYTRLKILYEWGGIYMDTDVFALNRIPDSYFRKNFVSWDDKFCSTWTNNGCITYFIKHSPLVKEFIEKYQSLEYDPENPWHNNWPIDLVLQDHGYVLNDDKMYGSLKDKDCVDITIVNRVQFGANDYMLNRVMLDEREPYLQHCHALSWMGPYTSSTKIYYAVLDDNTDLNKLDEKINWWIDQSETDIMNTLIIYVNTINGSDLRFSKKLLIKSPRDWKNGRKFWFIQPLGNGISEKETKGVVTDFLLRRFNNILFCKNIMR